LLRRRFRCWRTVVERQRARFPVPGADNASRSLRRGAPSFSLRLQGCRFSSELAYHSHVAHSREPVLSEGPLCCALFGRDCKLTSGALTRSAFDGNTQPSCLASHLYRRISKTRPLIGTRRRPSAVLLSGDEPIRQACKQLGVVYSTWIDDLAFSGERARDLIQIAADTLRINGLRISRNKIHTMGPRATKMITGTRLGADGIRAPGEKLSRIRSGIFKFELGLVSPDETERYIKGLVAQLRFVHQLCPKDAVHYARKLRNVVRGRFLSASDKRFLATVAS